MNGVVFDPLRELFLIIQNSCPFLILAMVGYAIVGPPSCRLSAIMKFVKKIDVGTSLRFEIRGRLYKGVIVGFTKYFVVIETEGKTFKVLYENFLKMVMRNEEG